MGIKMCYMYTVGVLNVEAHRGFLVRTYSVSENLSLFYPAGMHKGMI